MNERIRELLIEAHKQTKGGIYSGHPAEWSEKFAKLIVRECSGILREEANSNWEGREERLLNVMASWIEKHFGVSE